MPKSYKNWIEDEVVLSYQKEISKSLNSPLKLPALKIVIAGRNDVEVEKATLISNLLNFDGERAARTEQSIPATGKVKMYSSTVNGVHIQIYDTPDPIDDEVDGREIMNEIWKQTEGSISLLFYIFSLKTELTETHRDKEIIKLFTE